MDKTVIHTSLAPEAIGTYSQAVKVDQTVYLSGQIPLVPETMKRVGEDIGEQIEQVCQNRPILQKLLNIKPKWGIDFSLDYVTHEVVMEVIHIEQDFDNLEEAYDAKERLEKIIDNTDWYDGAISLWQRKEEWENLSSDDHSDYKAQFFGWERAFDNKKVFST